MCGVGGIQGILFDRSSGVISGTAQSAIPRTHFIVVAFNENSHVATVVTLTVIGAMSSCACLFVAICTCSIWDTSFHTGSYELWCVHVRPAINHISGQSHPADGLHFDHNTAERAAVPLRARAQGGR